MKHIKLKCSLFAVFIFINTLTGSFSAAAYVSAETESVNVPIIMYHEVKTYHYGKDVISPWELESDLIYLRDNGYTTVTMSQLIDYVYNGVSLPEKPIVLSFDDGYLSNYVYVYPLLKRYQVKMVFSIIGKNTDEFTNIPDSNIDYSHVTWDQLGEMLSSGLVEVQNHSYNLHSITKRRIGCDQAKYETFSDYVELLSADVMQLQRKITEHTHQTATTFTYPYGAYCDNTNIILRTLGFKATLSCDYGISKLTTNPESLFCLKRICRAHGQSVGKLLTEAWKTVR